MSQPPASASPVRRVIRIALILFLGAVLCLVVFAVWREIYGERFTISPATTYITEPLRPDGLPDYAAALDALAKEGVTPENNAAVLYWQAFGPALIPPARRDEYFGKLGIPVPSAVGDYFLTVAAFEDELKRRAATVEADASDLPPRASAH